MIKFESEKLLEDYICSKLDEGVNVIDKTEFNSYKRQFKCGNYGFADIVTFNLVEFPGGKSLEIYIYELKNESFNSKFFSQVARYYTYFKNLAEERYPNYEISVYPSLVCYDNKLSDDDYILNIDDHAIPVHKYSINPEDGFSIFEASGCKLKDEGLEDSFFIDELMI